MCYKRICELPGIMLHGEFSQQEAAQIMYHSIFGTIKDDLGILSQITNCATWYTREDLGKKSKGAGTTMREVKISPIKQVYYSKLASANQTGILSAAYLQNSSVPVFSGNRTATFTEEFSESIGKRL